MLNGVINYTGELFVASHKYELVGLRNMCETYIQQGLSEENVVSILSTAEFFHSPRMINFCVK